MDDLVQVSVDRLAIASGACVEIVAESAVFQDALSAALTGRGVRVEGEDTLDGLVLQFDGQGPALLSDGAVGRLSRLSAGAVVVVICGARAEGVGVARWAALWGPRFGLESVSSARVGSWALLVGLRRPGLDGRERRRLRGLSHQVEASVLIGRAGLTVGIVEAVRVAVERHGLMKAKLTPQCETASDDVARALVASTGAALVQRVGRTIVLFRSDVPLAPPVARRGRRKA